MELFFDLLIFICMSSLSVPMIQSSTYASAAKKYWVRLKNSRYQYVPTLLLESVEL